MTTYRVLVRSTPVSAFVPSMLSPVNSGVAVCTLQKVEKSTLENWWRWKYTQRETDDGRTDAKQMQRFKEKWKMF